MRDRGSEVRDIFAMAAPGRGVLVTSCTPATGNRSTAERLLGLATQLTGLSFRLVDASAASVASALAVAEDEAPLKLVIGIHAYRAGKPILESGILRPGVVFILVLGGTDMNEHAKAALEGSSESAADEARVACILKAIQAAHAVVCFTEAMKARYEGLVASRLAGTAAAEALSKVRLVPQAVLSLTDEAKLEESSVCPSLRGQLGLPPAAPLLLLPAGLREVKRPLYLAASFQAARQDLGAAAGSAEPAHLVIVGPVLDATVGAEVAAATGARVLRSGADEEDEDEAQGGASRFGGRRGLWYHPPVPNATLRTWMRDEACIVLNSSDSEGQSNALLEAMADGGGVVLARRNEGNASLVRHGETGLLYDTPEEAMALAVTLLRQGADGGPTLARRLAAAARASLAASCHAPAAERAAWQALLAELGL